MPQVPDSPQNFPRVVPAFSPAVDASTAHLVGLPDPEYWPAGATLIPQGSAATHVRLVRSGVVRLYYSGADGREVVGLRSEGWWVGGTLAFLGLPSLCSIETVTACSLSSVPAAEFSAQILGNAELLQHFLMAQCREILMLEQHRIMQGGSALERLRYLQGESGQSVWETVDPSQVMRQGEIATLLSITPEHLSRLKSRRSSDGTKDGAEQ